jgi:hypothetical protein
MPTPRVGKIFIIPDILAGGILFSAGMAKTNPQMLAVFRSAAKANSYAELETAIPFQRLRATCAELVEGHDRALKQAAERKEARRWTLAEDETLRLGFREGRSVGELAEQLGRTPLIVENRLAKLGILKIAHIRRAPLKGPTTAPVPETPLEPAGDPINPDTDRVLEINSAINSCESTEDELYDRYAEELAREQAEADRAREEEFQTELEEWQAAADARAAEEQAASDDPPEEGGVNVSFARPDTGAGHFCSRNGAGGMKAPPAICFFAGHEV